MSIGRCKRDRSLFLRAMLVTKTINHGVYSTNPNLLSSHSVSGVTSTEFRALSM